MSRHRAGSTIAGEVIADKPWVTEQISVHTTTHPAPTVRDIRNDPAGSAATVQGNLDLHELNETTAHGIDESVTTTKVSLSTGLVAKHTGFTILFSELGNVPKIFICEAASDQTFTFAAPVAADIGKQFSLVKTGTGAGKIILDCPAGVYVDDSSSGGTITSAASARQSALFVVISTTQIQTLSATGSWTTA